MPLRSVDTAEDYLLSFQRGEEKGFDHFFHQLYPALCYFAYSITHNREASEEIASEAFIRIWKRHDQFNNANVIKAYIYQIVKNDSLKYLQAESRVAALADQLALASDSEQSHFESIVRSEVFSELHHAISSLPHACRQIFEKLYIEGKSVNEAAEELQISPSTVRNQKVRGLEILRKKVAF